jgi:hypothetical protein
MSCKSYGFGKGFELVALWIDLKAILWEERAMAL